MADTSENVEISSTSTNQMSPAVSNLNAPVQTPGDHRQRWGLLAMLLLANGLMLAPSIGFVPLIPQIKANFDLTFSQVGFFSGIAGLAGILCALPAGAAIARFGYKRALLGGIVLATLGLLALAIAKGFVLSLTARALWQVGVRFAVPAAVTGAVLCTVPQYRSTAMGLLTAAGMLATVATMNVSSAIAEQSGWRASILFFGGVMFCAAAIATFLPTMKVEGEASADPAASTHDAARTEHRSAYRQPWMWVLCLLVLLAGEEGVVDNFAALQMQSVWGYGPSTFAKLTSIGLVLAVGMNLVIGLVADRFGRWPLAIAVCGINLVASLLLLVGQHATTPVIYSVGLIIAKAFQLSIPLLVNSMAPAFMGRAEAGRVIALTALGASLGQFIGPQSLGWLRDITGSYSAGWLFMSATCAATLTLALLLRAKFPSAGSVHPPL
ncbi:MFS transporter [Novosphingobium flavum]|uniref:MFS transporter n=1 Tax=Novosphingobium flavum TaxID=1778672 RepID=A0A7X1FRM3_9SPHN|nr:MFS transporter [Novosphingobium flavum]MBC2665704.1 MFS transporter [Novosphingobium flavum]